MFTVVNVVFAGTTLIVPTVALFVPVVVILPPKNEVSLPGIKGGEAGVKM